MVLTALTIVAAVPSLGRTPDRWLEWDAACHERGVIPERRPSDEASGRLIAMVGVGGKQTRVAMRRGLARLKADMVARKVLCDDKHVGIPCNVSVVGADVTYDWGAFEGGAARVEALVAARLAPRA